MSATIKPMDGLTIGLQFKQHWTQYCLYLELLPYFTMYLKKEFNSRFYFYILYFLSIYLLLIL